MEASAALLPVVIYLAVVYSIDRFSLISLWRLLYLVLCGVLAAIFCLGLFQLLTINYQLSSIPLLRSW